MINISTVIKEIVEEDDAVLHILRANMLNLSSYARSIHKEVEKRSFKEVQLKSLIVALSRLAKHYSSDEDTFVLKLQNLSVHSNLVDISYEKTRENQNRTAKLTNLLPNNTETFFTITQGITEITIIADRSFIKTTKNIFKDVSPLFEIADLAGITLKTDITYLKIPKVIYELSRSLLMKKISIVEIVSTTTEITFIVDQKDVQLAIPQLSKFLS